MGTNRLVGQSWKSWNSGFEICPKNQTTGVPTPHAAASFWPPQKKHAHFRSGDAGSSRHSWAKMVGMGGRGLDSLSLNSWFPLHTTHTVWSIYHACVYVTKKVHSPSLDDPVFEAYGHIIQYGTDIHRFWLWPEPSGKSPSISFLDVQASDKGHVEEEPEVLTTLEKEMREATNSLRVRRLVTWITNGCSYVDHIGVYISSGWLNVVVFFHQVDTIISRRCFQIYLLCSPKLFGEDFQFDYCFSNGLKPPPSILYW